MFIDEVKLSLSAWRGWNGIVSWRREKYIPKGWPWGGDGWNGGNVFVETSVHLNTLSEFRHKKELSARNGQEGWTNTMHGVNGEDLILKVPVWTIIKNAETGEVVIDMDRENMRVELLRGGRWGFGNAHFVSSTRQAPAFAELWDVAETGEFIFELKLVADVWIIWVPSAGKSTLISVVTNVKPKIGDYPFTTITPNLGVMDHKGKAIVLEDVPGLIPWAHEGKGLGIEFLKHIERTWTLLHLLDLYRLDQIFDDYENIRKELEYFSDVLAEKEEVIVLSKADLLDEEMIDFVKSEFVKRYGDKKIFVISSASGSGLDELKDYLAEHIELKETVVLSGEDEDVNVEIEEIKLYDLTDAISARKSDVVYKWDLIFEIQWERIEQIVRMTDFDNFEAVMRVYDVLDKMWLMKKIESKLDKIYEEQEIDNDFFFEWSDKEEVSPKLYIAGKEISLDKLKYKL